jgi:hypothetical protein
MDWDMVIGRQGGALRRILAALVAMVRSGSRSETKSPGMGSSSERTVRTRWPFRAIERSSGPFEGFERPEGQEAIAEGIGEPATLPRRLHRAVLRLLRTAEAAARRLVIVVARGMPLPVLPPARQPKLAPVVLPPGARVVTLGHLGLAGVACAKPPRPAPRTLCLPLADPLRLPSDRRHVRSGVVPRIFTQETARLAPVPPPLSPSDPLDATRLMLRLRALAHALDDLPGEARRLMRWKAWRARARALGRRCRVSPLRPGRAPGSLKRPTHEAHHVLKDLHCFAWLAEQPDTS